jgi:hypothetical protein
MGIVLGVVILLGLFVTIQPQQMDYCEIWSQKSE